MQLAPVFCGAAGKGHVEQLRSHFTRPPMHSGWTPLSWPPAVLTLVVSSSGGQLGLMSPMGQLGLMSPMGLASAAMFPLSVEGTLCSSPP